jgi:hypothetical protein
MSLKINLKLLFLTFISSLYAETKVIDEKQIVPDTKIDVEALHRKLDNQIFLSKNLVPKNYIQTAETNGDLNADGINDFAILIKPVPEKAKKNKDGSVDLTGLYYDLPQVVLIYLGQKDGKYKFWKLGDSHFIYSSTNLASEDGVSVFKISNGVLTMATAPNLSFGVFYDLGCTQKWRINKLEFQLIGLTKENMNNLNNCSEKVDINYLSGDKIVKFSSVPTNDLCKQNHKIIKSKSKVDAVFWDKFNYELFCAGEN